MAERYDVIIIGSGAGGGTLAHTLAAPASGSSSSNGATSSPARWRTGTPSAVFVDGRYMSEGDLVRRRRQAVPAAGALLRRRRHQAVRRGAVPAAAAGLRRAQPRRRVSPAWPLTYDEFEPWYTKAEWLYQVHGNDGEDPTEGHWSKQYPWPAVSHEPRIQQLSDDLERRLPPVPRAVRDPARRGRPRRAPASAARGATATRASCTRSPTPRRSRCARSSTCRT